MKYLNDWTYTVCITLIFSIIFSLLLPKNSNGKVGKIIITVFNATKIPNDIIVVTIDKINKTFIISKTLENASKTVLDSLSKNTLEQIFAADIESRQRVILIIAGKNIADIAIIPTIPTLVLIRLE